MQRRRGAIAAAPTLPHEVRIIGGALKRSRLPVPDRPGLRPTPQRVRETLFNWLGQDLSGWTCLDAFAGSGALGFEAASRGAASVLMLEREPDLVASLRASRQRLKADAVRIERAEALAWLRAAAPGQFDLVLLDPPFDQPALLPAAIEASTHLIKPAGVVYAEAGDAVRDVPPGFTLWRQARAGAVWAQVLRRNS
ncbi:MAG TPA: 16S rRNA (guanine(966)-N(2))-methyltransferase RsmD [Burkholderiaceae bacterium]